MILKIKYKFSLMLLTFVIFSLSFNSKEDFTIIIARKYSTDKCTSGYLSANGKIICYTLERPWKENSNNISSIPLGTYKGILRYDHNDLWRIELLNVPKRSNVQIHIGNQVTQSKGCILVGEKLSDDLCSILGSANAYKKLKIFFYGTENPLSTPNLDIEVIVSE